MRSITNFFLSGFDHDLPIEKRKASFLLYIIFSGFIYLSAVLIGQLIFKMGLVYFMGNLIGLGGVLHSLILFKQKRIELAGHILAFAGMAMLGIHNIGNDLINSDPAMRYRIYLHLVGLFGIYFLIISFFRNKKVVYVYGLFFEIQLLAHAFVIYLSLRHIPKMASFVWQHWFVAATGIIAAAVISTWLLDYIDTLFKQSIEDAQRIKEQNEALEKIVEERTRSLQASLNNLQEFSYIVSHDLKEPLRTISGFITLLKKDLEHHKALNQTSQEYINYVVNGTHQMEKLIHDILDYSRLNVIEKNFVFIDMNVLTNEVMLTLNDSIKKTEVEITIANLSSTFGEPRLIKQLMQNLISNAIKYKSETEKAKVYIYSKNEKNTITYFVQDNGIGFSEKYYNIVFQAFKRLHGKVKYEGSGIGLAICKKIVDIHNGTIHVESQEGKGTTFYFSLPKVMPIKSLK